MKSFRNPYIIRHHYVDRYYKFNHDTKSYDTVKSKNGYLYYYAPNRNYATKISEQDLPPCFYKYWDGNAYHYLDAENITDIVYQPVINNHVLRDDSLYISYDGKIKYDFKEDYNGVSKRFTRWIKVENEQQYERIWGSDIIDFLMYAKKYSGYNIESIKEQIWQKMLLLEKYENETFTENVKSRIDFDEWFKSREIKIKKQDIGEER